MGEACISVALEEVQVLLGLVEHRWQVHLASAFSMDWPLLEINALACKVVNVELAICLVV